MKKFSNAIWSTVLAAIAFICYFFIPAAHLDGVIYAGFILLSGALAYFQDAITLKNDK